jgi:hypothetical protein
VIKIGSENNVPLIKQHWVAFVLIVPALIMLSWHTIFDYSDALMVQAEEVDGKKPAYLFNLIMALSILAGICGSFGHIIWVAKRGITPTIIKLSLLGIVIMGIFYLGKV